MSRIDAIRRWLVLPAARDVSTAVGNLLRYVYDRTLFEKSTIKLKRPADTHTYADNRSFSLPVLDLRGVRAGQTRTHLQPRPLLDTPDQNVARKASWNGWSPQVLCFLSVLLAAPGGARKDCSICEVCPYVKYFRVDPLLMSTRSALHSVCRQRRRGEGVLRERVSTGHVRTRRQTTTMK